MTRQARRSIVDKKPLDYVDFDSLQRVVFTSTWSSKLGDNIIISSGVHAVRDMLPAIKIDVFSKRGSVCDNIPGVTVHQIKSYEDLRVGEKGESFRRIVETGQGVLVIGGTIPHETLKHDSFTGRGNWILAPEGDKTRLYSREFREDQSRSRSFKNKCPHQSALSEGVMPVEAYERLRLLEAGFTGRSHATINTTKPEDREASRLFDCLGLEAENAVFVNPWALSDDKALLGEGIFDVSMKIVDEGVGVCLNPGRGGNFLKDAHTIQGLVNRTSASKQPRVVVPENMDDRVFFAFLKKFPVVVTPDTGVMWAAAALNSPITVAHFSSHDKKQKFSPESTKVLPCIVGVESVRAGVMAARQLVSGRGLSVFTDEKQAARIAGEYVGLISRFDPVFDYDILEGKRRADRLHARLKRFVKPEYKPFFESVECRTNHVRERNPLWWYEHQQHPLYRFCDQILARESRV